MRARRRMRAAMVVALGAAAVLPALAASAGSASASTLGPDPALSGTPNPSWWGTNGRVMDILPVGNRVYLAGGFDYVGPATGYGVGVDAAAGIKLPGAPVIDGVVRAAVADGQGGWFIGGDFKYVGGQFRRYAAQVTAAGAVTAWNPKPDQPVEALAFDGATVFLGGAFSTVRDAPAPRLAAVAPTGAANLVPGFQPAPDGRVTSLLVSGGALFAGGEFGAIGGAPHARVARLDRATGAASAAFTAGTDQTVRALAASPDGVAIYAGGDFGQAGGAGRAPPGGVRRHDRRAAAVGAERGRRRAGPRRRPGLGRGRGRRAVLLGQRRGPWPPGAHRRRRHRPALRRRPQRLPDAAHDERRALQPDLRHRGGRADRGQRRPVRRRPVLPLRHHEPARRGRLHPGQRGPPRLEPRRLRSRAGPRRLRRRRLRRAAS